MTATLHKEQYSSFFALASSVSGLGGLPEAGGPVDAEIRGGSELRMPGKEEEVEPVGAAGHMEGGSAGG